MRTHRSRVEQVLRHISAKSVHTAEDAQEMLDEAGIGLWVPGGLVVRLTGYSILCRLLGFYRAGKPSLPVAAPEERMDDVFRRDVAALYNAVEALDNLDVAVSKAFR